MGWHMARDGKRSMNTETCNEIAERATWFVTRIDAGKHADKRTAQRFNVSVRMAQMLRSGQGWTLARVEQARRSFGPSFDHMVFGPLAGQAGGPSHALAEELAQLQSTINRLATAWRRGPMDDGGDGLVAPGIVRSGGVAAGEAGRDRLESVAVADRDSGDPARHPAMAAPVKRAAE